MGKTFWSLQCIAVLTMALMLGAVGVAQAALTLSSGYDSTAVIQEVGKFRQFGGTSTDPWSGYNGYEAILGNGLLNPNTQIDFYRGTTDDGSTPYGHWSAPGTANHVTVSYDKTTGKATMTLAAQYSYSRTMNIGDLGLLNYLQIDVVGRNAGITVDLKNVYLNNNLLGDFSGTGGWFTWNVKGLDFTNGFTVAGDIFLGGTMPTGGQETDKVVISAGSVSPVPIPDAVWLLGSGLVGLVGIRKRQRK